MALTAEKKRRQRYALWRMQKGRCHWCGCEMVKEWDHKDHESPPKNLATFDHLDDRFSPDRGSYGYGSQWRRVLACWLCNFERGRQSQAEQPIEELHRRSQLHGENEATP